MAVGEAKLLTDNEIEEFIKNKIHRFKSALAEKNENYDSALHKKGFSNNCDSTFQFDCSMQKSERVASLPETSTSCKDVERQRLSCAMSKPWTTAAGQTLEKDRLRGSRANGVLTQRSKGHGHTSSSEKHSADYPQKILEAASTSTKNKTESRLALSRVPETTVKEVTEKYPSLTVSYTSSQEKYEPLSLNTENNLGDRAPGPWFPKHMTRKEKEYKDLKPKESSGLDSFRGVPGVSEDLDTQGLNANLDANANKLRNIEVQQHCSAVYENETVTHSTVHSTVDKNLIGNAVYNQTSVKEDTAHVHSQADFRKAPQENKLSGFTPLPGSAGGGIKSETVVKDVQYEDISDSEDVSWVDRKPHETEHVELGFSSNFENIQYENISEDENPQIQIMAEMSSFPPEVSKSNIKQNGLVQDQAQMKTISEEELIPEKHVPKKTETPDIAQHFSCENSFETNDCECPKSESERPLGWQTNNSYSPSSVSEDEDESDDEMDDDSLVVCLSVLDIKFEPVDEEQDHPENLLLGDGEHAHKSRHSGTSPTLSGLALPAPDPVPATAFSQIEVFDTVERFQKAKCVHFVEIKATSSEMSTSERNPTAPQNWSNSSSEPDNSSDTEDSCDYSSGSKHNYLTVPRQLFKNQRAPASSTTESEDEAVTNLQKSQTKSTHNTSKEEDIIILDSDLDSESDQNPESVDRWCGTVGEQSEKCAPLSENGTTSGHAKVKISEQKISDVIVLTSDTEDNSHQKDENKTSTGSEENFNAPCVKQKRKTMSRRDNTAKKTLHEARRSSAVSSKPQHGCELEQMQNASPELVGADDAQQEQDNRQMTSKSVAKKHIMKRKRKRIRPSETEDSEDTHSDHENASYSNKNPRHNCLSEDSPEKQLHHSTLDSDPVTHFQKSCQSSELLKLLKGHTQTNDETLMVPKTFTTTPIRKKYKETPHSYRNRQESVVSKLKPSNTTLLPKVKQSSSKPSSNLSSSELRRSQSYPSTQDPCTPRKSPSPSTSKQSSARKQVTDDWGESYVPTRRDRKEDIRTKNSLDVRREARPASRHFERAPRRRHVSFESETPLMKRTKTEAIQWTNAINRKAPSQQRYPVGEGYKWKKS